MARRSRLHLSPPAWLAVIGSGLCIAGLELLRVWQPYPLLGFGDDYYVEALPAYRLLAHGHLIGFVDAAPSYIGSMVLRAPAALIVIWSGGTSREDYVFAAAAGLLAAPILAGWLWHTSSADRPRPGHVLLAVVVVLPTTAACLSFGHPEDVLTAALGIAGVVCAGTDRSLSAGVLMALATWSKPWAAGAIAVGLVISPHPRAFLLGFVTASVCLWGPVLVIRQLELGSGSLSASATTTTGSIFGSAQLLYVFGRGSWPAVNAHPLIVVFSWAAAALWWVLRREDPTDRLRSGLWLLAMVFFIRCAFDPWDSAYYPLPFLMTLLVLGGRRETVMAVVASVLLFLVDSPGQVYATSAAEGARLFAIVAIPILLALATRVYASPDRLRRALPTGGWLD